MPSSPFYLEQGIITEYVSARTVTVLQIPDHYVISNVRLPHTLSSQLRPMVGSLVLVAAQDSFKSYVIAVLRDPEPQFSVATEETGFNDDTFLRGAASTGSGYALDEGEVFLQAGGAKDVLYGDGASLHLSNSGTIEAVSSEGTERFVLGGETSDVDDKAALLQAANIDIESPVVTGVGLRSFYKFDDSNLLRCGNSTVSIVGTEVEIPISELKMTSLGEITLRNTTLGVDKGQLKIDTVGAITLKNTLGSLDITALGNVNVVGPLVSFNNGTLGVARLTDQTTSNISIDPTFWTFWQNLSAQIAALPTGVLDGGALLKTGLAAVFALTPTQLTSTITSASATVRAG